MKFLSTISSLAISAVKLTKKDCPPISNQGGYWVHKGKVYFYGGYPNKYMHLVDDADAKAFKPLIKESATRQAARFYGKDNRHVYYHGKAIKGADPVSFQVMEDGLSQDGCAVYWGYEPISNQPGYFTKLGFGISKDLHHVYGLGKIISDDPDHFELLGHQGSFRCYRDSRNVYINHLRLGHADASTFQLLPLGYGRDKSGVYYLNLATPRIIPGADPSSFQIINQYYGFDTRQVYRQGSLFTDFDAKSLTSLINKSID